MLTIHAGSIRNVAATVAHDAMAYYKGNLTTDPNSVVGSLTLLISKELC